MTARAPRRPCTARRWISIASASDSAARSPTWRYGATIRRPRVRVLVEEHERPPRPVDDEACSSSSTSRPRVQKTHPLRSSAAGCTRAATVPRAAYPGASPTLAEPAACSGRSRTIPNRVATIDADDDPERARASLRRGRARSSRRCPLISVSGSMITLMSVSTRRTSFCRCEITDSFVDFERLDDLLVVVEQVPDRARRRRRCRRSRPRDPRAGSAARGARARAGSSAPA